MFNGLPEEKSLCLFCDVGDIKDNAHFRSSFNDLKTYCF